MADPASTASVALIAVSAAAVPVLTVAGVPLGLRADELLAGFAGALAAMALLDSVPAGGGDGLTALLRTTGRRVSVSIGSALTAGYTGPLVSTMVAVPDAVDLAVCFVVGVAAQRILRALADRVSKRVEQTS